MAKFMIDHDRPNCIGCAACASVAPEFWTMDPKDGKSDLVGSQKIEDSGEVVREQLDMDDLKNNMEAANCCPVNVIHIIDKTKNEKII